MVDQYITVPLYNVGETKQLINLYFTKITTLPDKK